LADDRLRALASIGVFAEVEERRFTLTPPAACLRSDAPESLRSTARWIGSPLVWRSCGELLHSVETGETAVKHVLGATDPFA